MDLKNIYLLHHSHYDRGYTHSQVVIEHLQADFINQAIEMMETTADWEEASRPRWTIEVHEQLRCWLATASPEWVERLKLQVRNGRIGLGAIQFNTTPLSSVETLCKQLVDVRDYRETLGFPVKVAFQHDVNGIPWVMSDLLLDAGVELLVMAVNLHTGGNGPKRPGYFKWVTPQGRTLRVFSGHHYGTFDAVTEPVTTPLAEMKSNMDAFWQSIVERGYAHDFLYLSTTHSPVADDNGAPCIMTAEKVREWNRQDGYPTIEYVTPEQLLEKLECVPDDTLPEHRGDWSDYWNYGAGSTACETTMNANSKQKLFSAALLTPPGQDDARLKQLQRDAWGGVVTYDEHTWGMDVQASRPWHAHSVTAEMKKRNTAHDAQEIARYVLASRLSRFAGNPVMHHTEGLLAVNPSPLHKQVAVNVLPRWRSDKVYGHLNGFQYRHSEVYDPSGERQDFPETEGANLVQLDLPPFSAIQVPWSECQPPEMSKELSEHENTIESPFHRLEYDPADGRILRLLDKRTDWEVTAPQARFDILAPVHEKPDPDVDASRRSYYAREIETEQAFESCWNPDWKAARTGPTSFAGLRVQRGARTISLVREYALEGALRVIQKFELSADRPSIDVDIIIHKDRIETPESIYFVSQLNLTADWQATYDASGIPTRLDDDQLEHTSRGWITAEAFTRLQDAKHQFSAFAPGMPLVQLGDFHFGQPPAAIPRAAQPLHVLWACNNYWETNFPVTQEGVLRFSLALHTSTGDSNADTYRAADAFARKPLLLPLATCPAGQSQALLQIDNTNVRLVSIDAARYSDGTIYRFANPCDVNEACALAFFEPVESASIISATEEALSSCSIGERNVHVDIPAMGVISVLVAFR